MKRFTISAVFALSLMTAPVNAQTASSETLTDEQFEALGSMFGEMFGNAEPLSKEEELRLPAAMLVVSKLMPDGTMARMMEESLQPIMESMMGGLGAGPAISVGQLTGLSPLDLAKVDSRQLEEAANLLDPSAEERNTAMSTTMFTMVSEVMVDVEPAYRAGLARAYAVRFSKDELDDLAIYFSTSIGAKYAAESYLIFADPQVMASMNDMMPAMMQRMPEMMENMEEIVQNFPEGRRYSDLTASEQERLVNLLSVSPEALAQSEPVADTASTF